MNNSFGFKYRRILAYCLDMFLVFMLATLLANNVFTNPLYNKYPNAEKNYTEAANSLFADYDKIITVDDMTSRIAKPVLIMEKNSFFLYVWIIVLFILYFIVFAYYTNGQTLGKKLLKLKIVEEKNKKIKLTSLIKRSIFYGEAFLFIGPPLFIIIRIFAIFILKRNPVIYFYTFFFISLGIFVFSIIEIISFFKGKTFHDKISKTKVIDA